MIGYLKPKYDDLRVYEYKQYRSFYCGLCTDTKKNIGELERMLLSHDMTFFAILLTSLGPTDTKESTHKCSLHCFKAKPIRNNQYTSFMADMGFLFAYEKLRDDKRDERSLKSTCGTILFSRKHANIVNKYPLEYEHLVYYTEKLNELESNNCSDYKLLGNLFGDTLVAIFRPLCTVQTEQVLKLIQYLGQWIYCIDALEDLTEDIKNHQFNPLKKNFELDKANLFNEVKEHLNSLLLQIVYLYTDMEFFEYKGIIFNTLCISIREKTDAVYKSYDM